MKTYRTIIKGSSTVALFGSDSPRERRAFVYTHKTADGRTEKAPHKHAVRTHYRIIIYVSSLRFAIRTSGADATDSPL